MEAIHTLIPLLITVSLVSLVLAAGLNAGRADLLSVLHRPVQLLKAILAVIVVPPTAAAIVIAAVTPLDPVVKASIILMTVSPTPLLAPGRQISSGGRKNHGAGLYAAVALLMMVSAPAVLALTTTMLGGQGIVSLGGVARAMGLGVLLPLAVGLTLREIAPVLASRIWPLVHQISIVLLLLAFTPVLLQAWPALFDLIGNGAVVAMAAVTITAVIGGHLLGGRDRRDRAALAMASAVRHPGIAMSLAGASFADPRVSAAALLFMVVGVLAAAPYSMWARRQSIYRPAHP